MKNQAQKFLIAGFAALIPVGGLIMLNTEPTDYAAIHAEAEGPKGWNAQNEVANPEDRQAPYSTGFSQLNTQAPAEAPTSEPKPVVDCTGGQSWSWVRRTWEMAYISHRNTFGLGHGDASSTADAHLRANGVTCAYEAGADAKLRSRTRRIYEGTYRGF